MLMKVCIIWTISIELIGKDLILIYNPVHAFWKKPEITIRTNVL